MRPLPPDRQPKPAGRRFLRAGDLVIAASLGLGVPAMARAACTEGPEVCARRSFEAGIEAYRDGHFDAALGQFRLAQELRPHPVVLFNVALAEARVGQLVESLEHLDQVYDDPNTPENLLGKVRMEREATAARVAVVSVTDGRAQLLVDGEQAAGNPPTIRVNPGEHEMALVVDGQEVERRTLRLAPGEKLVLNVPEPPAPASPPPASPPPPPPAEGPIEEETSGLSPGWVYGGAGLTVVLGGVTLWSGLDTRRTFHDYEDDVDDLTQVERDDRVDEGRSKQFRTNVLVGATSAVGLATVAAGLFLVDWPNRRERSSLTVGPASLRYQRRF